MVDLEFLSEIKTAEGTFPILSKIANEPLVSACEPSHVCEG